MPVQPHPLSYYYQIIDNYIGQIRPITGYPLVSTFTRIRLNSLSLKNQGLNGDTV